MDNSHKELRSYVQKILTEMYKQCFIFERGR